MISSALAAVRTESVLEVTAGTVGISGGGGGLILGTAGNPTVAAGADGLFAGLGARESGDGLSGGGAKGCGGGSGGGASTQHW
jgi:hypothetical protein